MLLLDQVPLNGKKAFVMGIAPGGCEVYLPVNTNVHALQDKLKLEFQLELDMTCAQPPVQLA